MAQRATPREQAARLVVADGSGRDAVPLDNTVAGQSIFNTDLAFWGNTAYQGTYEGFRIIDVTAPANPVEILNCTECSPATTLGNQGDVVVWGNILVRSWKSNTTSSAASCDGEPVASGFEGLHVFDVSNPLDPDLVASVDLPQGLHTATGVPDLANNRLLVYNSSSSGANPGIDIVEIPFGAPENAAFLRFEPAGRSCHDTGVILGDVLKAACAGGNGFSVWNLSDNTVAGAMKFDHLNPQTQETAFGTYKAVADQQGFVVMGQSAPADTSGGEGSDEGFAGNGDGLGGP